MARIVRLFTRPLRRLARSEEGASTLPFVIFMPFYLLFVVSSIEMGLMMVRHVMLERGLDIAVRELRLGLNPNPSFTSVKTSICRNAGFIPNCMNSLHLELRPISKTTWEPLSSGAQCINRATEPNPIIRFDPGASNEMMLIRACAIVKPMAPGFGLGASIQKDTSGYYRLVSSTAFVNEPRLGGG